MDVRSDVDEETENQRAELGGHQHFECTWYSCTHTVSAVSTRRVLSFWILPVRPMTPTWFWGSLTARQKLPSLMPENGNTCTTCAHLSPTPGFFAPFYYCQCLCPYINGQRCSDTNDGLFERRVVSVYNAYLHILWMIEPGKDIRFSSSVKNLHSMHLSRRLHRSTSDGLLMVAQRKGALNMHCILARFMHIWDQHMYAPELYCLTFGDEPASGLGQSSTADQPCHG